MAKRTSSKGSKVQFPVRITKQIHREAIKKSKATGIPLSAIVRQAILDWISS